MIIKQNTRIILSENRKNSYQNGKVLSKDSITYKRSPTEPTRHFGPLRLFREVTVAEQQSEKFIFDEAIQILILPIIGTVQVACGDDTYLVAVDESLIIHIPADTAISLVNNYKSSAIHYLVAGFVYDHPITGFSKFNLQPDKSISLFEYKNENGFLNIHIGKWRGRSSGTITPSSKHVFAFVIQGAIEMEDCLLQKADGLAMYGKEIINFEALSSEAIMIFLELNS
ncbi:hypothetical protein [Arthrospiribacter ruber]|uniref:Quercetin 2,3-dioxygenase C-terminal cupin domain-containing protein n=1 Tax=Arthrospiribacter ruber TaxID=2487934 RepID=A0A951J765_9BACT|nr:hypothetical protein [Arthrospiribacter ruber]MBW3470463.1 hypothetical protein [Arthrospiribacter ruber]